jgi:hypothetical protein
MNDDVKGKTFQWQWKELMEERFVEYLEVSLCFHSTRVLL